MSIYYDRLTPGELWTRNLKNNVDSANNSLSSIFYKYQSINSTFFSELTSNRICKLDVFYDSLFLETETGFIFEKTFTDNNFTIRPFNQINQFNLNLNTRSDYWFDEQKNKIYFTQLGFFGDPVKAQGEKYFVFVLFFREFNCTTGLTETLLEQEIKVAYTSASNWKDSDFSMETPKLTYNKDTRTFNVSFIIRNTIKDFGILSINILDINDIRISEISGFLPFMKIDPDNCSNYQWVPS